MPSNKHLHLRCMWRPRDQIQKHQHQHCVAYKINWHKFYFCDVCTVLCTVYTNKLKNLQQKPDETHFSCFIFLFVLLHLSIVSKRKHFYVPVMNDSRTEFNLYCHRCSRWMAWRLAVAAAATTPCRHSLNAMHIEWCTIKD